MDLSTAWEIIGGRPGMTLADAERAFRLRAQMLHPDKYPDASPELSAEANEAMSQLNQAWAIVSESLGGRRPAAAGTWDQPRGAMRSPQGQECRMCGAEPTSEVRLRAVTGTILWYRRSTLTLVLCRTCGVNAFRELQSRLLVRGWWGLFALLASLRALAGNLVARHRVLLLAAPVQPPPSVVGTVPFPPPIARPVLARPGPWIASGLAAVIVVLVASSALYVPTTGSPSAQNLSGTTAPASGGQAAGGAPLVVTTADPSYPADTAPEIPPAEPSDAATTASLGYPPYTPSPTTITALSDPASVVDAYFADITAKDYAEVWRLGGSNLSTSYESMVSGYAQTARDDDFVTAVTGDSATVTLIATEQSGVAQLYQGQYQVDSGTIISGALNLVYTDTGSGSESFAGRWTGHGRELLVTPGGIGVLAYRTYTFCGGGAVSPCDLMVPNGPIVSGGLLAFRLDGAGGDRTTGYQLISTTTGDASFPVSLSRGTDSIQVGSNGFPICGPSAPDSFCGA